MEKKLNMNTPLYNLSKIDSMEVEKLEQIGEIIIFGKDGRARRAIGKAHCGQCHTFFKGDIGDRAPGLYGVSQRAEERIKDPRYLKPDFIQMETFPGSGRATTALEYLVESKVCPSCYVVKGFGASGSKDRQSPQPAIHQPPIGLTIEEMIAVDIWLYVNDGVMPPPVPEIRAAYNKFIQIL